MPWVLLAIPWILLLASFLSLEARKYRSATSLAWLSMLGGTAWLGISGYGAIRAGWDPLSEPLPSDVGSQAFLGVSAVLLVAGFYLMRAGDRRIERAREAAEERIRRRREALPPERRRSIVPWRPRVRAPAGGRAPPG